VTGPEHDPIAAEYEDWLAAQEQQRDLRATQIPYADPETTPSAIEVASWD